MRRPLVAMQSIRLELRDDVYWALLQWAARQNKKARQLAEVELTRLIEEEHARLNPEPHAKAS